MFRFQSSAPKAPQHSQYSWVKSMRFCRSMSSRYALNVVVDEEVQLVF
uniref:Uncharacterized protein n=1 Tax=Anguilla anguilla TaxID=7936 RepID=A0A0E9SKU7_ANGAN